MRNSIRHILIIRLSAMGDVAMLVPVLRLLRHSYPNVKLTVLTRPFFSPMFEEVDQVDVFPVDLKGRHKGFIGLLRLSKELKGLGVDAVADVHNVLRTKVIRLLLSLSNIKRSKIDKGRKEKKALTRSSNKVFKQLKSSHQRYVDVFTGLGYPVDLSQTYIPPSLRSLSSDSSVLLEDTSKQYIGIAPFAQHLGKTYPLELMEQVISGLNKKNDISIILFGGKNDASRLDEWATQYTNVTSLAGRFNFREELTIISRLSCMLSMDSGNAHLAAIYAIPIVTIWGVTHPFAGFMPFNHTEQNALLPDLNKYDMIPTSVYGNKVPDGYDMVMHSIAPELIIEKVLNALSTD